MKSNRKKYFSIILPTHVGNFAVQFSQFLKNNSLSSLVVVLSKSKFFSGEDISILKSEQSNLRNELNRLISLKYLFYSFDVLFCNFASTIYGISERPSFNKNNKIFAYIYHQYANFLTSTEFFISKKIFKRKIVSLFQGSDARIPKKVISHRNQLFLSEVSTGTYNERNFKEIKKNIDRINLYSDIIYFHNPDLYQYLPKRAVFLPYCHLNIHNVNPVYTNNINYKIRIGHAPSNRSVKGTRFILEAIDRLKREGFEFEFILIEGLSNNEAFEIYKTLDVFIDQLLIGWYGGVAVELMALGKPVVCYIEKSDLSCIPVQMKNEIPIINSSSSEIYKTLKNIMIDNYNIKSIGELSREYVLKWHDQNKIFESILKDIRQIES